MEWRSGLSQEQGLALDRWLEDVLHDLVKYLELMPLNIDWEAIEEDDLELLWEAIFETRVDRSGSRSAREIWELALEGLPEGLPELPVRGAVSAHVEALEGFRGPLEAGELEGLDVEGLRGALFGIGSLLRGLRSGGA